MILAFQTSLIIKEKDSGKYVFDFNLIMFKSLNSYVIICRGDPYDPQAFKEWASRGLSRAIPPILQLFHKLIQRGFKVFLITGRDEIMFEQPTLHNLHFQGFFGFERLILR